MNLTCSFLVIQSFFTPKKAILGFIIPLLVSIPAAKAENTPDETLNQLGQQTRLAEENEAIALLNRMNYALHQLSYRGTLVYRHNENLSTLQIDHSVINGVAREHVVSLNDQGSEVSRELKGFSLASIPVIRPEMELVYSFDMGRENRVANIPCRIITARPKDRVRYLQKFCIDTISGLLLDYMLVGKNHKPVEQFMFTSIEINTPPEGNSLEGNDHELSEKGITSHQVSTLSPNTTSTLTSANNMLDQAIVPVSKVSSTVINPTANISLQIEKTRHIAINQLEDGWEIDSLPAGFQIRQAPPMNQSHNTEQNDEQYRSNGVIQHYIVSDGLTSFSVFVAPLSADFPGYAIQIKSGALNVISRKKYNHMITAVGEVPEITLKRVVNSLHRKEAIH